MMIINISHLTIMFFFLICDSQWQLDSKPHFLQVVFILLTVPILSDLKIKKKSIF